MMCVAGVDIGRVRDHTAVVILEEPLVVTSAHRLRLGQDWRQIVIGVANLLIGCTTVCVDATGLGSPIAEALRARTSAQIVPVTFTVATKQRLIQALTASISSRQLRVAPGAPGREELREELLRFTATPTRRGWVYTGKGYKQHDDLVTALALALKGAEISSRANASPPSLPLPSPGPPHRI